MSAVLLPNGKQQFIDINGKPLVGGSVYFYIPSTLIFKDTWKNAGQTILNTNPIILDSRGQAIIYGTGIYRQIVKDSAGNLIWDQLTSDGSNDQFITPQNYGAVGDGTADDTAALQSWLTAIGSGYYASTIAGPRVGFLPAGKYKFTTSLTLSGNSTIFGVKYCSVLQPSSAVTGTAFMQSSGSSMDGITIDGVNAAAGVIGLGGAPSPSVNNSIATRNVSVVRFSGMNSCGLRIIDAEHWNFEAFTADSNYDNIHIGDSASPSAIDTVSFFKCLSKSAVRRGLWGEYGTEVNWYDLEVVESGQDGILLYDPTASGGLDSWRFFGLHLEVNWISAASGGTRHSHFHMILHSITNCSIRDSYCFAGTPANEACAINIIDSRSYVLDNFRVPNYASEVATSGTSIGSINNWPEINGSIYTTVANTSINPLNPNTVMGNSTVAISGTFVGTVSALTTAYPAASVGPGYRAFVTDATATTFHSTVAGSGANSVPVVSDGTNWIIG